MNWASVGQQLFLVGGKLVKTKDVLRGGETPHPAGQLLKTLDIPCGGGEVEHSIPQGSLLSP